MRGSKRKRACSWQPQEPRADSELTSREDLMHIAPDRVHRRGNCGVSNTLGEGTVLAEAPHRCMPSRALHASQASFFTLLPKQYGDPETVEGLRRILCWPNNRQPKPVLCFVFYTSPPLSSQVMSFTGFHLLDSRWDGLR